MHLSCIFKIFLSALLFVGTGLNCLAQDAYERYIDRYHTMAVEQMHRHGIPASITLAQGLLESGAGQSRLAREANNHFGIKADSRWTGRYLVMADDRPDDRFRVYRNVAESYEDHSLFLCSSRRYAGLFSLSPTDYRGWARGLKAAGYATNPRYAESLISIIERYSLHRYDVGGKAFIHSARPTERAEAVATSSSSRQLHKCNGSIYTIAMAGDTWRSLSRWSGVSRRKLRRYNEMPKGIEPSAGDIVYFEKKRSKAARTLRHHVHTVQAGESLHSIAQHYGIRLKTLQRLNGLDDTSAIRVGQRLVIRR
ncbi:MAG: glucosaminidase domain-containing protein [Alloprevotella sp.]